MLVIAVECQAPAILHSHILRLSYGPRIIGTPLLILYLLRIVPCIPTLDHAYYQRSMVLYLGLANQGGHSNASGKFERMVKP